MQYITKLKLAAVHQICDAEDKSTEYTLQYMQDSCRVSMDCVLVYFDLGTEEHKKLFKDVNSFTRVMAHIEQNF